MAADDLDWDAVADAGLLADADDVEDRKELLRLLAKEGLTLPEMVTAHAHGALMRVVGERTIRPGVGELTLREAAGRAGVEVEVAQRILRALGAIAPEPDEHASAPDDVELFETAKLVLDLFGERTGWSLLRRYGSLLERLTEASSAAVTRERPDISTLNSGSEAATARAWTEVADLVPRLGRLLDLTSRHQIEAVRRYFEEAVGRQVGAVQATFLLGVGFADLSGYTAASRLVELEDLGGMIADFEARTIEVVAGHGGRIVKFVGDAVLFVSSDPDALVAIAADLVAPIADSGALQARAGLARGAVLAQDGDYFGPVVNLAARLVDVAAAGTVVLEEGLRSAIDQARWELADEAPRQLRGIDELVTTYRLVAQR